MTDKTTEFEITIKVNAHDIEALRSASALLDVHAEDEPEMFADHSAVLDTLSGRIFRAFHKAGGTTIYP